MIGLRSDTILSEGASKDASISWTLVAASWSRKTAGGRSCAAPRSAVGCLRLCMRGGPQCCGGSTGISLRRARRRRSTPPCSRSLLVSSGHYPGVPRARHASKLRAALVQDELPLHLAAVSLDESGKEAFELLGYVSSRFPSAALSLDAKVGSCRSAHCRLRSFP